MYSNIFQMVAFSFWIQWNFDLFVFCKFCFKNYQVELFQCKIPEFQYFNILNLFFRKTSKSHRFSHFLRFRNENYWNLKKIIVNLKNEEKLENSNNWNYKQSVLTWSNGVRTNIDVHLALRDAILRAELPGVEEARPGDGALDPGEGREREAARERA